MDEERKKMLYEQIGEIARRHQAEKVVLFGSRATNTSREKSDIDLAVFGCRDFTELYFDMNENLWTLLELDLIDMEKLDADSELAREIRRDGVVIYEKI